MLLAVNIHSLHIAFRHLMRTALSKKLLLAVRPQDFHIVSKVIGREFDALVCVKYDEAVNAFKQNIGLIACSVHFDGGKMFELLLAAKYDLKTRRLPFYVLLGGGKGYSKIMTDGICRAANVLG